MSLPTLEENIEWFTLSHYDLAVIDSPTSGIDSSSIGKDAKIHDMSSIGGSDLASTMSDNQRYSWYLERRFNDTNFIDDLELRAKEYLRNANGANNNGRLH
jgi:hypothetical protein